LLFDLQADWTFIVNETALDLVVTNFPNSPLTIFVLGKSLYETYGTL